MSLAYLDFVKEKMTLAKAAGFTPKSKPHPRLKPHQVDMATWAIKKGRAAVFASFGLGKTTIQLQLMKWVQEHTSKRVLIVAPLGVRQEFTHNDGPALGMKIQYCRTSEEALKADTPFIITNYERIVNGNLDVNLFAGITLDEASLLRSLGSKTTQTFFELCADIPFKFVATATPSPNSFKELLHYAHFLGVMDTGQALTRFFMRNSKQAGDLRLMPNQEHEFWLWLASWAVFVNRPSDLGYDDTGYNLPKLNIHWHEVKSDLTDFGQDSHGQTRLLPNTNAGLSQHAKFRKASEDQRIEKALEIVKTEPDKHWLIWHDLESERYKIERQLKEAKTVYGSQDLDEREQLIIGFANGEYQYLATKPSIAGSGCNFQRHCANAVFVGVDFKFNDVIQAVHRIYRFMQTKEVNVHFVFSDLQTTVRDTLLKKWAQHEELTRKMELVIKEHGLSQRNLAESLQRSLHEKRVEVKGDNFTCINNDCVIETALMPENSVHEIITSIPFSNHYEYTPSYNDFGHNQDDQAFFDQMNYLIPELYRVLKPGRIAAIHVKDRIMYGNVTGVGMYHLNPFSDMTVEAFRKHGFIYMGRITVDTDVVRENAQTYRLGWSENAKDSTKMGVGSCEYVLLFRKWEPSMSIDGTANAPEPVTKDKTEYTRSKWQIHASGIWRSSGNRLLDPDYLKDLDYSSIIKLWREKSLSEVYDLDTHTEQCQAFEDAGRLPSSWMLFAPHSSNPDIWTDILRINTLNTNQSMKATQNHVCLARDSKVLTYEHGYKPIQDIEIGEHVLTHKGRWMPVIAKKMTSESADVVSIRAAGVHDLTVTPTHKLWARKADFNVVKLKDKAKCTEPDWMEAKDLEKSYINHKLPPFEESNYSEREWWIIGRYIADGHIDKREVAHISCGNDKLPELLKNLGDIASTQRNNGSCTQVALRDKDRHLRDMFDKCGRGAANKVIPPEGMRLDKDKSRALLYGYLSGDGHYNKERKRWSASSISKDLLLGLQIVIQRVHDVPCTIQAGRKPRKSIIEGRTVNCQQEWVLSFQTHGYSFSFSKPDGVWKRVKSVLNSGKAETWNIRVLEDESYTAEGCVVKNCPLQLDVIERLIERYSNKGELIFDPFGGIGSVVYQALKMKRKGIMTELNTDYWQYAVGYCESVEIKKLQPTLFDLMSVA